jgi:hypothetical protein
MVLRSYDGYKTEQPRISSCLQGKGFSTACFDGLDLIRDFTYSETEKEGIDEAVEWFKQRTCLTPEIVKPRITKMNLRYGR